MIDLQHVDLGICLVTGGTGTFGHAFAKRVLDGLLATRVVVYSRDEYKQAQMRAEFDAGERLRFILGDVRDREQMERALGSVDTVVHAAALKQVDRSATDILEFKRTIVDGTQNVITACHARRVKKLCVLSTDKAVEACTPYGACKALAEWLAISGNVYGDCRIFAVRYGNVVGSRGSVLDIWERQHTAGCPLTITDERMTRFWLPIEDAVELVLYGMAHSGGGEIFIPKVTAKGRVVDFASDHFQSASFHTMGKRSYEKVHEVLIAPEEADRCVDVGECYVLLPRHVRWQPGPFGAASGSPVGNGFEYRSDGP